MLFEPESRIPADPAPVDPAAEPVPAPRRRRLRILLLVAAALAMLLPAGSTGTVPAAISQPARARIVAGAGPRTFSTFQPAEREVVSLFDRDHDKMLNAAERDAAVEWLATLPSGGEGWRGRRFAAGTGFEREPATAGQRVHPSEVKTFEHLDPYEVASLRTIFLQFEKTDWEQELASFYRTDVDVPATVTIDGKSYDKVGVHFRGNSSYRMVPAGYKRSLNLAFDFVHDGQDFRGYRTLNLLNANNDPTFVRDVLYSTIARRYIPAPKANFVRVVINGESWGVFISAQQFNKDFLRDFYGSTKGARWKTPGSPRGRAGLEYLGDDPAAYKRLYEIKTKDDAESWSHLVRLCRVLNQTPLEELESRLEPILDVDGVLRFLALEIVLDNSDGYWARASDYSLYEDDRGRFHVVPHDMNEGLEAEEGRGRGGWGSRGGPELDPLVGLDDSGKPLRSRLLAVPALRARYLTYVRQIASAWLDWKTIGPLVTQYQELIAADVKADTRKLYDFESFTRSVGDTVAEDGFAPAGTLRGFVERRRSYLLR